MKRWILAILLISFVLPAATLHGHATIGIEPVEPSPFLQKEHPWRSIESGMMQTRHTTVDVLRWMSERSWAQRMEAGPFKVADRLVEMAQEREEQAPQPAADLVYVSSRFGPRFHPVLHRWRPHRGVDFAAPRGTPILAVQDGTVKHRGWLGAAGRAVVIEHDGFSSHYAHLSRFERGLRNGDEVVKGEVIGYVGASGRATGHHLHFGIKIDGKWVDPLHDGLDRVEPLEDAVVAVGLERGFLDVMRGVQSNAQSAVDALGAEPMHGADIYDDNFL